MKKNKYKLQYYPIIFNIVTPPTTTFFAFFYMVVKRYYLISHDSMIGVYEVNYLYRMSCWIMGFVFGFHIYSMMDQGKSRYISKTSPETCSFFCTFCWQIMLPTIANTVDMCPIAALHKICTPKFCQKTFFKPYCVHGRGYRCWSSQRVGWFFPSMFTLQP